MSDHCQYPYTSFSVLMNNYLVLSENRISIKHIIPYKQGIIEWGEI